MSNKPQKFDPEAFRKSEDIDALAPKLATLSNADLAALHKAESGDKNPREKLLAVIAAVQAERAKVQPTVGGTADAGGGTPPAKPKWQDPAYTGPLTIDQAGWRRRNIKPAQVPATK